MPLASAFVPLTPSPLSTLTPGLLLWELLAALALTGYGLFALGLLHRRELPLALALPTGISVWLALGGPLNLFGLATRPVLLALLLPGLLAFCREALRPQWHLRARATWRTLRPQSATQSFLSALVALWLLLCLLAHATALAFNRFDDLPGYLAFALKASAFGGLQPDPFSERRVTSGVGGSLFLNSTMLATGHFRAVDFLEGTFGFLALLLGLLALTRHFRLGRWSTLLVLASTGFFTLGRANLSSTNLSAALFLAILLLLLQRPHPTLRDAVLLGLLLAGAFCLKSSNIPFCALLLLFLSLAAALRARSLRPLLPPLTAAGICLLLAAPWAIQHLHDEGTLLFPILGRGDHLSAHGFPSIAATSTLSTTLLAALYPMLLPAAAALFTARLLAWQTTHPPVTALLAFFAASALSAPLFSVSVAAADLDRFLLPVEVLCALLFLCVLLWSVPSRNEPRHRPSLVLLVCASSTFLLWCAGFGFLATNENFFRDLGDIGLLFHEPGALRWYEQALLPGELAARTAEVQRAQDAVPPGATLLEFIDDAWAFQWHRNPVLLADYPGMSSPPPGLPLDGSPEDVRRYLLAQGIHFVVDQHETRMATDYALFRRRPVLPVTPQDIFVDRIFLGYINMEYTVESRTRALLDALAPGRTVFDDGHLFVLDLDR